MTEHFLPNLKISTESEDIDLKNLIQIIKPSWNLERLKVKGLSGGYSSKMFRCYDETNREDSASIRIRHLADIVGGDKSEKKLELKVIQYLSTIGHFPKVHAIFNNGYCYQYIEGKPMIDIQQRTGHVDDRMLRAIADEMAFVHSLKFEDFEDLDVGNSFELDMLLNYLKPETRLDYGLNKQRILNEINLLSIYFEKQNSQRVLCHGDPHPGNYVWNEKEGKVTFVDWEGTHIGYQLEEIAQFFLTIEMVEAVYAHENYNKITEDTYKEQFVKYYFEAWKKLNDDKEKVTENEVATWIKEIEIFYMLPLLLFIFSGLIYPNLAKDFAGNLNLIEILVKDYLTLKEKIFGRGSFETE